MTESIGTACEERSAIEVLRCTLGEGGLGQRRQEGVLPGGLGRRRQFIGLPVAFTVGGVALGWLGQIKISL